MRRGFSLIDLILAIGIIATLFGGIFLVYFSIIDTAFNYELRRAASVIMAQKVELVRNLPYEQVGVSGGIPAGILPQSEQVDWDGQLFVVEASVRNIDDPFDGTVTSTPRDSAPADYKLVEFSVACPTCARFTPVAITTTVAPQGLESASQNGSLFVSVFDANGQPVQGADVTITNASTSPAVSFTDVTDETGMLQLVDVPTSTQRYHVVVAKDGYSREQTYAAGSLGGSVPGKPDATVASQAVTELSFAIDRLSAVTFASSDERCQPVANAAFSLQGEKLIGTGPDVYKYAASTTTGAGAARILPLEWDTYSLTYDGAQHLVGTVPIAPFAVAPGTPQTARLIVADADGPALQVGVRDAATGLPLAARVHLAGPASVTATTSQASYRDTDWSGGTYAAGSGISTSQGQFTMSGPPYTIGTPATLESATIDLGGTPASVLALDWDAVVPAGATLRFQVAASADNSSWQYIGPDGSAGTYFTQRSAVSGLGGRYVRYKAYLTSADGVAAPTVTDVRLEFSGPCVPPGQRLFTNLPTGTYTVTATADGHAPESGTLTVGAGWQSLSLMLDPS